MARAVQTDPNADYRRASCPPDSKHRVKIGVEGDADTVLPGRRFEDLPISSPGHAALPHMFGIPAKLPESARG